jgi:hypothetical protein
MYQLQKGNRLEWLEYGDLTEYLDQIMAYENERKARKLPKKIRKELMEKEKNLMIDESVEEEEEIESSELRTITDLVFIEKKENYLKFKAYFNDGSFKFLTNQQVRKLNPNILLDFYEKYIVVSF